MVKKAPRRTAQRILETALDLFNRFGEPNVSTTLVATDLGISPGNLYYHYPAKEQLINRLCADYQSKLETLLRTGADIRAMDDAERFIHGVFELIWCYRFLYRDLNDLLSKNRHLETHFQQVLRHKSHAMTAVVSSLRNAGQLVIDPCEVDALSHSMVLALSYWLSYEYVRNPRQALEPEHVAPTLLRGARATLHVLTAYLAPAQRQRWLTLDAADARRGTAPTVAMAHS